MPLYIFILKLFNTFHEKIENKTHVIALTINGIGNHIARVDIVGEKMDNYGYFNTIWVRFIKNKV